MEISNDVGLRDLLVSSEEEKLCSGFKFTEGPVWVAADNCLLFSDIPGNRIHRWRPGSDLAETYRAPSGFSNGLTIDSAGNLVACEHAGRRVSRGAYNAAGEDVARRFEGKSLNSPNDLVIAGNGTIYFTDPNYGIPRPGGPLFGDPNAVQELDHQGVYRVTTDGALSLVVDDFSQPNGLAFNQDESVLYIGDSQDKIIKRYDVAVDGSLSGGDLFADMSDDDRRGVPDGMKVDEDGRLWSTGAGGVWVIDASGERLGVFEMAEHAANLAFGEADYSTLFLTAQTSVYRVETRVRGYAVPSVRRPRSKRMTHEYVAGRISRLRLRLRLPLDRDETTVGQQTPSSGD